MKLHGFSLSIPEGVETQEGYVHMRHGMQYSLCLRNDTTAECDAQVTIDGRQVGVWRIRRQSEAQIERPVHDTGRFTFYQVGTPEAEKAGISVSVVTGLISVVFKPERPSEASTLNSAPRAGGTGLSGRSSQEFRAADSIEVHPADFVTVVLRLVAQTDEPRPLFTRSTPIPPPVHTSIERRQFTPALAPQPAPVPAPAPAPEPTVPSSKKGGGRYALAFFACMGIFIAYMAICVALEWRHGGGNLPVLVLMGTVIGTWRAITGKDLRECATPKRRK